MDDSAIGQDTDQQVRLEHRWGRKSAQCVSEIDRPIAHTHHRVWDLTSPGGTVRKPRLDDSVGQESFSAELQSDYCPRCWRRAAAPDSSEAIASRNSKNGSATRIAVDDPAQQRCALLSSGPNHPHWGSQLVKDVKGAVPEVTDDRSSVPQDREPYRQPELSRTLARSSELSYESPSSVENQDARFWREPSCAIEHKEIAMGVESHLAHPCELLPVRSDSLTDSIDLFEVRLDVSIQVGDADDLLGVGGQRPAHARSKQHQRDKADAHPSI